MAAMKRKKRHMKTSKIVLIVGGKRHEGGKAVAKLVGSRPFCPCCGRSTHH
jgi:hypothetical protein